MKSLLDIVDSVKFVSVRKSSGIYAANQRRKTWFAIKVYLTIQDKRYTPFFKVLCEDFASCNLWKPLFLPADKEYCGREQYSVWRGVRGWDRDQVKGHTVQCHTQSDLPWSAGWGW